jgi:hypothetical protein
VPLLEARYILSRQQAEWRALPHLDLLHPNRRCSGEFDSHRLVRMEVELLGFEREDDCHSAEVPAMYFRFQRTSDPTHITPVLRHNAWTSSRWWRWRRTSRRFATGGSSRCRRRVAEYTGDLGIAVEHYERALSGNWDAASGSRRWSAWRVPAQARPL